MTPFLLRHGCSGSPAVSAEGKVVGILCALTNSDVGCRGYLIPALEIETLLKQAKAAVK